MQGYKDVEVFFFDISLQNHPSVVLSDSELLWNGHDLSQLSLAWIHGFSYMNPTVPTDKEDVDWSVWQADYLIEQQRYSFLFSLFSELSRRGIRLVNPLPTLINQFMKPFWLHKISLAGFRIPEILCSNDPLHVDTFCTKYRDIVWRPVTGRAAWQLFLEKQRSHLISETAPPILLAQVIPGPLIRCYMYRGKPLLFLKHDRADAIPPERMEQLWPCDYPELSERLNNLYQTLDMDWGVVYFVVSAEEMYVYDVDPDPVLNWLPQALKEDLTERLSQSLAGQATATSTLKIGESYPRPVLFLRRMLRVLFEIERIKYPNKQ